MDGSATSACAKRKSEAGAESATRLKRVHDAESAESTLTPLKPPNALKSAADCGIVTHLQTSDSSLTTQPFPDMPLLKRCKESVTKKLEYNATFKCFGKNATMHRGQALFAPEGISYTFSGRTFPSKSMCMDMQDLLDAVNTQVCGLCANAILVNFYKDGNHYISRHADNENCISNQGVVSVSLGATRKFRIRDKTTQKIVMDLPLVSGALLCMAGKFQDHYLHEIPPQARAGWRMSFTFRCHEKK